MSENAGTANALKNIFHARMIYLDWPYKRCTTKEATQKITQVIKVFETALNYKDALLREMEAARNPTVEYDEIRNFMDYELSFMVSITHKSSLETDKTTAFRL